MSAELIERPMTVIERASKALSKAESEAKLKELAEQSKSIVTVTDSASRAVCHTFLMDLKNIRIRIQTTGKEAREDATAYSKAVIAEEKRLIGIIEPEETRLAKIRDDWDTIKEREKEARIAAELARTTEIQRRIDGIRQWPIRAASQGSLLIGQMLAQADDYVIDTATFEEFTQSATDALMVSRAALAGLFTAAKEREAERDRVKAEREELAKLRAEAAERDRLAAIDKAKADADAKTERDRLEAVAKAERDAEKAKQEEANRIEKERQVAEAREHAQKLAAERAENERIASERQAALDRQADAQRKANADEDARLAAERVKIAAEREAIRKANEPKSNHDITPTSAELIYVIEQHYKVPAHVALGWIQNIDWTLV